MLRWFEPLVSEGEASTRSGYFAQFNCGKESIVLDLALAKSTHKPNCPEDREIFEGLLSMADVVVENFRPGRMERLGYGWDTLHQRHPK